MKSLAIGMIEFYQRFLSPYKGYRCAHAAYYGSLSCSEAVKQIVQREGLWGGRRQIRDRFRALWRRGPSAQIAAQDAAARKRGAAHNFNGRAVSVLPVVDDRLPSLLVTVSEKPPFREHPAENEKHDDRPSSRDSFNKRDCCGTGELCIVIPCDVIPFDGCLLDLFCVGCDGC